MDQFTPVVATTDFRVIVIVFAMLSGLFFAVVRRRSEVYSRFAHVLGLKGKANEIYVQFGPLFWSVAFSLFVWFEG